MIYQYKTEGSNPKDFIYYQNQIDLFINLRDDSLSPREVLKNLIGFKSVLGKVKTLNPKLKSEDQIRVIKHVQNYFDLKEINF